MIVLVPLFGLWLLAILAAWRMMSRALKEQLEHIDSELATSVRARREEIERRYSP